MAKPSVNNHSLLLHLIEDFHSSELTISQKLFKIKKFVSNVQSLTYPLLEEDIDDMLESIEAIDFPAKRLKLELANEFKRPLIILEYLKKEEKLLVKRALQFQWIYSSTSSLLTNPKTLVRIILPTVSYVTRTKILKGISRNFQNEKSCQEIFTLVQEKYGTSFALDLLPACSSEFIQDFLLNNRGASFMLNRHHFKRIVKKDFSIVIREFVIALKYVKSLEEDNYSNNQDLSKGKLIQRFKQAHEEIWEYLCLNHTTEFVHLRMKYGDQINLKLKPSLTKTLISNCKDTILQNGPTFIGILSKKILFKYISLEELVDFCASLMSDEMGHFESSILVMLERLSRNKSWEIVKLTFFKKYEIDIMTVPEIIPVSIMEIMPPDLREVVSQTKLDDRETVPYWNDSNACNNIEGFWSSFFTLDKSIPMIKKLLYNQSDAEERSKLLCCLINTCYINGKDSKALVDICKLFLSRYRNDSNQVRKKFLDTLTSKFKLHLFLNDKELWGVLIEFIKLLKIHNEHVNETLLSGALHHCLLNNLPMDGILTKDDMYLFLNSYTFEQMLGFSNNKELEQRFFKFYMQELEKKFPLSDSLASYVEKKDNHLKNFLIGLSSVDKKYSQVITIKHNPWLAKRFLELSQLSKPSYGYSTTRLRNQIRKDPEIMKLYLQESIKLKPDPFVVQHYLRTSPNTILIHYDTILSVILSLENFNLFKEYRNILFKIKTQGYSALQSSITETCLEQAQNERANDSTRQYALRILSILWDSTNYLNIVSLFYPTSPKIDLRAKDEDFQSKYKVKTTIVQSLVNITFPSQGLSPVGKFCIGDHLKLSIGSLYSICMHAAPQDTLRFLREELLDSPVSVKKHAIRLICLLSTYEEVEELLNHLWENETNLSIKKILVSSLFTHLAQSMDPEKAWNSITKPSIISLDTYFESKESDDYDISLELLNEFLSPINVSQIPSKALLEHFQICWNILEENSKKKTILRDTTFQHFIQTLIRSIDNVSVTLIQSLMKKSLNESGEILNQINFLSIKFLVNSKTEIELLARLDIILTHLISFKKQMNDESTKTNCLKEFITQLCKTTSALISTISEDANQDQNLSEVKVQRILMTVLETIQTQFDATETFTERLFLQFSLIFDHNFLVNQRHPDSTKYLYIAGQQLQRLTDKTFQEHHSALFYLYMKTVKTFFKSILETNILETLEGFSLINGLISLNESLEISVENQLLACNLLPNVTENNLRMVTPHKQILSQLQGFKIDAVSTVLSEKQKGIDSS